MQTAGSFQPAVALCLKGGNFCAAPGRPNSGIGIAVARLWPCGRRACRRCRRATQHGRAAKQQTVRPANGVRRVGILARESRDRQLGRREVIPACRRRKAKAP